MTATPATQKRRSPKPLGSAHCPTPATQRAEPRGTPGRTSDPLAVHIVPRLPHKRGGAPRDAKAYIRPLGSAHCPTPATQKRRSPKDARAYIRKVQSVPRLPRHPTLGNAHCPTPATQKRRSPKGRQGVQPLGSAHGPTPATQKRRRAHIVPRLPRKRRGAPRDARAYIRPLGSAHCPTPATQKRWSPKGRQGVHPTPWECTLSHACYAKEAESQGTPGRTSDPLAVHIVPRLARKRGGAPWQCTLSHACHAKDAEPQGTPGRTSDPLAVHIVPCLPRKSGGAPRDARAYIRPLGCSAHCPTPATQKRRSPKGRQGVHPTPWQCTLSHACHAKDAEPQGTPGRTSDPLAVHTAEPQGTPGRTSDPLAVHIVPCLPRKSGGAPRDARAYIRPLGSAHCPTPATQKRRSPKDAMRTSDPLAVHISAHCATTATQKRRRPKGREGVHPTPWQCTLSHACHTKEAEPQGTPRRTSDPLAVHIDHACHAKRGGAPRTPGRTSEKFKVSHACHDIRPLATHIVPQKRRSPKGRQGVQPLGSAHGPTPATQKRRRAYIRPLHSAHCPTPATQKTRSPKGRQGVHPTPWQCTLSHACHAKAAEPQGTPGRTSDPLGVHIVPRLLRKRGGVPRDARAYIRPLGSAHCPTLGTQKRRSPLAMHIVPRLPRKRRGAPRDARAYIRPLGSAHCPLPATQKRRSPKGRQGVHPTPWLQCTLSHACHAKAAEPQGTPGRTSDPLAVHIVPRLPRKRRGAPRDARAYIRPLGSAHGGAPRDARAYIRPPWWQCTLSLACHAKAAEPQGTLGRTSDPLAVHIVPRLPRKRGGAPRTPCVRPTPWQCTSVHIVPRLPRKRGGDPRDARAYIRPLGSAHCPTPATQKRRSPKGRQGVHPTPWQCTLTTPATQKRRSPKDARAYIRKVQSVPRLPRHPTLGNAHCPAKEAEPQGTPGRPTPWQCTWSHACHAKAASDPFTVHIVPRLPRKRRGAPRDARAYIRPLGSAHCPTPATQKRRSPKGRQGVHPTPWQCTLTHACHAKEAESQRTPGRTSDPLAVHIVMSHAWHAKEAEPLGNAHCPTPATQKTRSPKGRQGVHPTPWQRTLSLACHAKEAEPQGTPGRPSDPLAVHMVPRLPRKSGGAPRDARAYIRPLHSAHCPTPATQKTRSPKGRQGVHPTPWQCTLSHACHAKAAERAAERDARSPKVHPGRPWECTLSHACYAKEAESQRTPGRTSDPLAVHIVMSHAWHAKEAEPLGNAHCPTPATQKTRSPKGRQGVHPTPWQCTLSLACHAKAAEPQGTPGRTSDPLAVHIVPRLPRKSGGAPRDARAYIRPLGSAHCPLPATQKRRSPKGR